MPCFSRTGFSLSGFSESTFIKSRQAEACPTDSAFAACEYLARISSVIAMAGAALPANLRVRAASGKRRENRFRRDIAHQIVAREGAAAESRERAIESAAPGIVGRQNFFRGALGPAVQMNAELDSRDAIFHGVYTARRRIREACVPTVSARETVRTPISLSQTSASSTISGSPGLFVRIAKRHGNINHKSVPGSFRGLSQLLDQRARFSAAHVGIRAPEIGGDGIRISDASLRPAWPGRAPCLVHSRRFR